MSLGGRSAVVEALGKILDARRDREADVRPARVVGRNTDGSAQLLRLDGECVSRGGQGGYPGEIVTELPSLRDRRGTAGVAGVARRTAAASLWVERLEPRAIPAGSAGFEVEVVGSGFTPSTVFAFYLPGTTDINPSITFASTYVSSTSFLLTLYVAADAALFADGPLGYDDAARHVLRRVKANAYDVVSGSTTRFWGFWITGGDLIATTHRGGSWLTTRNVLSGGAGAVAGVGRSTVIHEDAGGRVGAASFLYCPDTTTVSIWDVEGDSLAEVALDPDYSLVGGACYANGWVYWLERETERRGSGPYLFNHRLCRCRCDGTDEANTPGYQVLATEEASTSEIESIYSGPIGLALTTTQILGRYGVGLGVGELDTMAFGWDLGGIDYVENLTSSHGPPPGTWEPESTTHALSGFNAGPKRVEVTFDGIAEDVWPVDPILELSALLYVGYSPGKVTVAASGSDAENVGVIAFATLNGTSAERFLPQPPPEAPTAESALFVPMED